MAQNIFLPDHVEPSRIQDEQFTGTDSLATDLYCPQWTPFYYAASISPILCNRKRRSSICPASHGVQGLLVPNLCAKTRLPLVQLHQLFETKVWEETWEDRKSVV